MSEITVKLPAQQIAEAANASDKEDLRELAKAIGEGTMHISIATAQNIGIETAGLPIYR